MKTDTTPFTPVILSTVPGVAGSASSLNTSPSVGVTVIILPCVTTFPYLSLIGSVVTTDLLVPVAVIVSGTTEAMPIVP